MPRENTSSGRNQEPAGSVKESGARTVAKVLGSGEPGKATGFRPGGMNGYNVVGGRSGLQVKLPDMVDKSNVHAGKATIPGKDLK